MLSMWVAREKIPNPLPAVKLASSGAARERLAAFGAGVELFDDPAEVLVGGLRVGQSGRVVNLLRVPVHLHSAPRANHLAALRHGLAPFVALNFVASVKSSVTSVVKETNLTTEVTKVFTKVTEKLVGSEL